MGVQLLTALPVTSVMCCQKLLQQCDEDRRPPESIVHALRTEVDELQDSF